MTAFFDLLSPEAVIGGTKKAIRAFAPDRLFDDINELKRLDLFTA
jgi:hypothetical protein